MTELASDNDSNEFAGGRAKYPFRFCDSVLITRPLGHVGTKDEKVRGGTGTLLRINDRLRMVTMKHVLDAYRTMLAKIRRTRFSFGGREFEPQRTLVGESEVADLALFNTVGARFERDAPHLPLLEYYVPKRWPPPRVEIGTRIFFGGWPEDYRELRDGDREIFSKPEGVVGVAVTDLHDEKFVCALDRTNWSASNDRPGYVEEPIDSGFSGSPAFTERTIDGVTVRELVGFLKGGYKTFDTVTFSYADFIDDTGLLR